MHRFDQQIPGPIEVEEVGAPIAQSSPFHNELYGSPGTPIFDTGWQRGPVQELPIGGPGGGGPGRQIYDSGWQTGPSFGDGGINEFPGGGIEMPINGPYGNHLHPMELHGSSGEGSFDGYAKHKDTVVSTLPPGLKQLTRGMLDLFY